MADGVQPSLGLEARASQDVYGSSPQSFPYVSFFPEIYSAGGGGSNGDYKPMRSHRFMNFGVYPSAQHESVTLSSGTVYCGFTPVTFDAQTEFGNNTDVWLNITASRRNNFDASVGTSASGDMSILLYSIKDKYVEDYLSGMLFIPYYN